jgi:hypothetical protein
VPGHWDHLARGLIVAAIALPVLALLLAGASRATHAF